MPDFTTSDGLRLHYSDDGAGIPVLCLAGLTRNGTDFDYVRPHLADSRMIALDCRGRGRSDWASPETYTIETETRDVLELLDHLALDRVAILGTSRGGLIALLLAATAPDRLSGIMLNDIGPEIAPAGLGIIMDRVGRNPVERTLEEAAQVRATLMAGFGDVPGDRWAEEAARHYVETEEGLAINYDPALSDAVRSGGNALMRDLWPLFDAAAPLPLAAIRGTSSDILTAETFARMRARRPDMIAAVVPERGHVPFLDEPEALEVLSRWKALL